MLPGPNIRGDVRGRLRKGRDVAEQEVRPGLLEGAGPGGRSDIRESEGALLAHGVFGLVVAVQRIPEPQRVAPVNPRQVIEERVVPVVVGIRSGPAYSRSAGERHGRDYSIDIGERLDGVDIGAVRLGRQTDRRRKDGALREVETG